ncbi:class I SAM-dependent methyltransferase [Cedecea sp. NFIX57]|uniref:class I SAM-dependent methyltransferase n=1 Tax=Cedecea sp. NFIX57 TaxID=1566286 RepID=UPI000A0EA724|nr:class I SAM-dependent methyltransferase [Cedecea sp. NFIX57]SMG29612.1 tRNA (cmo5U34)-methyltransferase [Cedecea sp. NFIX57]
MNGTNDIFNAEFSRQYDASSERLKDMSNNLHALLSLLLRDLPAEAKVLCVGVGTGTEIVRLAKLYPEWRFTGVDPSPDMLAVCAEKLEREGLSDRCTLIEGHVVDVPEQETFDAALCLLVAHFIQHPQRGGIYQHIADRLKPAGQLITAEIAGDMADPDFDGQLKHWVALQQAYTQRPRDISEVKAELNQRLLLLPPRQTGVLLREAGFASAQPFFQSLLIHAWQAIKP